LWFAELGFIYLDVLFFESSVWVMLTLVTFLVIRVLGLVVSPEEGSNLLPKRKVVRWVFSWQLKKFL